MKERDALLVRVAESQHGVFTGRQAVSAGFPRRTIAARVERGLWVPLFADAYRVATTPTSRQQSVVAAWLAAGAPSAVSREAALEIWGLCPDDPRMGVRPDASDVPTITVPLPRHPRISGVKIVRTRRWSNHEMVKRGALTVTSPARTLLDMASTEEIGRLEVALDRAHRVGLDLVRLEAYVADAARRKIPGAARLLELVEVRDPRRPLESDIETLLFAVLRRYGLPLPVPQYWVRTRGGPFRIDFAYPDERVALETDGYAYHGGRGAFENDRKRGNLLTEMGWQRVQMTYRLLTEDEVHAAWTVGCALGLVPLRWGPAVRQRRKN